VPETNFTDAFAKSTLTVMAFVAAASSPAAQAPTSPPLSSTIGQTEIQEGEWISGEAEDAILNFSDGARASLDVHAHARILSLSVDGAHLLLEQGRIEWSPGEEHLPLRLEAGPFEVTCNSAAVVEWLGPERSVAIESFDAPVFVSGPLVGEAHRVPSASTLVVRL